MMKKYFLSFIFLGILCYNALAQDRMIVTYDGSYTSTATSAVLDLYSTSQGFLAPRVALVALTNNASPVASPADGLLVYNNGTGGVTTKGFYYWDNTNATWQKVVTGNGSFVTGSGTQNYVTKWNNAAGTTIGNSQIIDNGTNVGIGSASPAQKLDVTGAIQLGTTATPTTGTVRWNSTFKDFEGYDGAIWNSITGMQDKTLIYTSGGF